MFFLVRLCSRSVGRVRHRFCGKKDLALLTTVTCLQRGCYTHVVARGIPTCLCSYRLVYLYTLRGEYIFIAKRPFRYETGDFGRRKLVAMFKFKLVEKTHAVASPQGVS